jgi:hypothetical protein
LIKRHKHAELLHLINMHALLLQHLLCEHWLNVTIISLNDECKNNKSIFTQGPKGEKGTLGAAVSSKIIIVAVGVHSDL